MIFAIMKHYRISFKIGWDFALTCNKLGHGVLEGLMFVVLGVLLHDGSITNFKKDLCVISFGLL